MYLRRIPEVRSKKETENLIKTIQDYDENLILTR